MGTHTLTHTMGRTHTTVDSPLGPLILVADDDRLCGVLITTGGRPPDPATLGRSDPAALPDARSQLDEYFAGSRRTFALPLAPRGSDFQRQVWDAVARIPFGERRTYGQIAEELGDPGLARAVGAANGRNPIAIVIPCHRVVGASGSLVGYAGGLANKRLLLEHEEHVAHGTERLF